MQEQRERADGGLTGRAVAVVVAGGRSTRLAATEPKQFLDLGGLTVLERSVRAIVAEPRIVGVAVVLPAETLGSDRARAVAALPRVIAVASGGETRAASVRSGLRAVAGAEQVLVHDAARPFVSPALVARVLDATALHGAAVPVLAVPDTLKTDDGNGFVGGTLDRARVRLAQTPQGARVDWLEEALEACRRDGVEPTDEAQALERAGRRVALVEGESTNVKITTLDDLADARRRLDPRRPDLRVGTGFDIHRFGAGRPLVLGGVRFPGEPGLEGHSDADVVLHAVMDAVLGAAGLEDIGVHFPPGEPRFAGADSARLAAEVGARVRAAGFAIVNVDVTVLAERPRIRDRVRAMREAIGAAIGVDAARVGVKATTLEGLGALGRGEGVACQAVALLERVEVSA